MGAWEKETRQLSWSPGLEDSRGVGWLEGWEGSPEASGGTGPGNCLNLFPRRLPLQLLDWPK